MLTKPSRIVDAERGRTLDQDSAGEVLLRGPISMLGYLDNEKATRNAFDSEGWLRTGDVGYMDGDGKLYIIDRKKVSPMVNSVNIVGKGG